MLSKLDDAISKFVRSFLRRGFKELAHKECATVGYAERVFVLDHVLLKAIYERGLTYLEIGCSHHPERLLEASGFRDLIDPPAQGRWNLGMGGAAEFLDTHWDCIYELLHPEKWMETREQIESILE